MCISGITIIQMQRAGDQTLDRPKIYFQPTSTKSRGHAYASNQKILKNIVTVSKPWDSKTIISPWKIEGRFIFDEDLWSSYWKIIVFSLVFNGSDRDKSTR